MSRDIIDNLIWFNRHKINCRWVALLWLMAVYYFNVISLFSAQVASESNASSGWLVSWVLDVITAVFRLERTETLCWTIQFLIRKLAHFTNFFILGFIYTSLAYSIKGGLYICSAITVFICGLSGAAIDEIHQFFVSGRSCELRDAVIDFSGVYVGYFTFLIARMVLYAKKN